MSFIIYIAIAPKSAFQTLSTSVILALKSFRSVRGGGKKGGKLTSISQIELPRVCADVFLTMPSMKSCLVLF